MSEGIFDNPDLFDAIFAYIVSEMPECAERAAQLKEATRKEFCGIEIYIPRRSALERRRLEAEVLGMFNGRNATEIARRLGIGRTTVYRIIKQAGGKK